MNVVTITCDACGKSRSYKEEMKGTSGDSFDEDMKFHSHKVRGPGSGGVFVYYEAGHICKECRKDLDDALAEATTKWLGVKLEEQMDVPTRRSSDLQE